MRYRAVFGTAIALSVVAGCGELSGIYKSAFHWDHATDQTPISAPGPTVAPAPKDGERSDPATPRPRFHGKACLSGLDEQGYSYNFCYAAQSDGFYGDITNAPPGLTDIRLKGASSAASLINTTPNREAPAKPMLVTFRALYNTGSLVCTTEGVGTEIYIDDDDKPEFCSVSWAGYAQNTSTSRIDQDGVAEFSSRSNSPIEKVPESSGQALIDALHQPHALVVLIDKGDRGVFQVPKECQVEVRSTSPIRRPFAIPVEGYQPVC